MIEELTFIHFLAASAVVELFVLLFFRFYDTGSSINRWYTNLRWSAIILDILSFLGGFYIAKFIYEYLLSQKYVTKENGLYKYLGILLAVQITHDLLFYFFVINPYPKNTNQVMDEFKYYASKAKTNAVMGDSIMYIIGTSLLYFIVKQTANVNIFMTILSFYIVGYLIYQKPLS